MLAISLRWLELGPALSDLTVKQTQLLITSPCQNTAISTIILSPLVFLNVDDQRALYERSFYLGAVTAKPTIARKEADPYATFLNQPGIDSTNLIDRYIGLLLTWTLLGQPPL